MEYTLNDFGNLVSDAATSAKNKVVSLFKSDDAPGDYTARSAAIARQKKLADMLSQMGAQEQAVSTAGGITAPVSGMGALARGLTSFGGAYLSGKASRDEEAATAAEKAAIQGGFADIFKRGDLVEQGAQLADDENGVRQYEVNTKVGGGKYILPPEERLQRLIEFVGNHPGAAGQANLYSNLIGDERPRADAERDRDQPKMTAVGANGMVDSNPYSSTYGELSAVPSVKPADLPPTVDEYNFAKTPAGGNFKGSYTDWLKTKTGATTRITVDGGRGEFSLKTSLRKEFNLLPDVKAFNDVASSYDVISDIANRKQPSPQDDLSLIYSYVKMLDPASVVREGEFATAENSASVPDRIRNAYNKVVEGTRLNSDQRSQYSNAAKGIYESRSRRYNDLVSEYSDYARDAGLDPREVLRARGIAGPALDAQNTGGAGGAGPAIGTVKGGYKFMGGNPADKNSWTKVSP